MCLLKSPVQKLQNKTKPQVIFIACCLFLHTPCTYSIWHEALHSTQQRKHASVLSLWLCWVPPVGLPAKGLEASEYLYTVHTEPSQTPTPGKEGPPQPSSSSLVPQESTHPHLPTKQTPPREKFSLVLETVKTGL